MALVIAGIVSFNPDSRLADLCRALIAENVPVVVVDNASSTGHEVLATCESSGARVLRLRANEGVAAALNKALDQVDTDTTWLLTFDQDSRVPDGYVDSLTRSGACRQPDAGVVAPLVLSDVDGTPLQGDPAARGWQRTSRAITSGSLTQVVALRQVGGFREDLFIDLVDFDLCLRLHAAGWSVNLEPEAVLQHSIGAGSVHSVAGRVDIRTSNHPPDRLYYRYRNVILLARSGTLSADRRWALRTAAALAWTPIKILAFEGDRRAKLRATAAGIVDGLRGRGGPRRSRTSLSGGRPPKSDGATPSTG